MDPIPGDRPVVRPVPREWLAPHQVDSTHLDRLCADAELAERLHHAGYEGPDWNYFVTELIKYGYAVLTSWMRTGRVWRRLADRGVGGLPSPPDWEWCAEAWDDLASETMVIAVKKFRDSVLIPGRWKPGGGASLKTFFIGQCLFRFPNVYRSWHKAAEERQLERPGVDPDPWRYAHPAVAGPEHELIRNDVIRRGLDQLDERTRTVLVLTEQGYDQTEIAQRLGTTRKSVEMILRRHRLPGRRAKSFRQVKGALGVVRGGLVVEGPRWVVARTRYRSWLRVVAAGWTAGPRLPGDERARR